MGVAEKNSGAPLPAKLAGLLREAKWLIVVAVAGYLLLIFATFHRGDPGWSRSVTDGVARNAGGVVGAWVSDIALYLFGLSDRKSTRLNSSHTVISYAVFCLKKKNRTQQY